MTDSRAAASHEVEPTCARRHRLSFGEYAGRVLFATAALVGSGYFAAKSLIDESTDSLAQKGAQEIEPHIGPELDKAVDAAVEDLEAALAEETDGVSRDFRAQIEEEVMVVRTDLFQVFIEYGVVSPDDVATASGGECPELIRIDCYGQR